MLHDLPPTRTTTTTKLITPRRLAVAVVLAVAIIFAAAPRSDHAVAGSTALPVSDGAAAVQRQFHDVVNRVSPEVVQIETGRGLGSGIVYDDRGDIVTNAHVAGTAGRFRVTFAGRRPQAATLVGSDPAHDLAVIRVGGSHPAPAAFAPGSGVRAGDIVFAIGNPLGLQSSATQGIVSNVNRDVGEGNNVTLSDVIQTSAEINPGNSGGALVDLAGRVVGIPTLGALDPDLGNAQAPGIGFAIPSGMVRSVADRLIAAHR